MKVKDLMIELSRLNPNSEVILQKDSEGNDYSPLYAVDGEAVYVSETAWNGKVYSMGWTADEAGMTEDEWTEICSQPRCVVLAPSN